jgi:hypothetical protein
MLGAIVRLLVVAAGIFFISYLTVRLVLAFQIRRASQLQEEVQGVNVGDSEDSLKSILERFGGHRWDVQLGSHEDYNYVLTINPWHFPTLSSDDSGGRFRAIDRVLNPRFRRVIGLREWIVDSEIAIEQHRVMAVQTSTVVEGRQMWLGAMQRLSEKTSDDSQYLAVPGILNMGSGTGTSWNIWTTPSSPKDQRNMANQLNFACLRSLSGCVSVCDLLPEAARFFSENPSLAPKGGGWDDSSRTCIKHTLRENQFW